MESNDDEIGLIDIAMFAIENKFWLSLPIVVGGVTAAFLASPDISAANLASYGKEGGTAAFATAVVVAIGLRLKYEIRAARRTPEGREKLLRIKNGLMLRTKR